MVDFMEASCRFHGGFMLVTRSFMCRFQNCVASFFNEMSFYHAITEHDWFFLSTHILSFSE